MQGLWLALWVSAVQHCPPTHMFAYSAEFSFTTHWLRVCVCTILVKLKRIYKNAKMTHLPSDCGIAACALSRYAQYQWNIGGTGFCQKRTYPIISKLQREETPTEPWSPSAILPRNTNLSAWSDGNKQHLLLSHQLPQKMLILFLTGRLKEKTIIETLAYPSRVLSNWVFSEHFWV